MTAGHSVGPVRSTTWERAYPIVRRPYLDLAGRVLALFSKGNES